MYYILNKNLSTHVLKILVLKQINFQWQSSYLIGRNRPVINYILGAYLFMNGLHVEQV